MWDNAILLRNIANALMAFSALAVLYGAVHYTVHLPGVFPVRSLSLNSAPQRVDAAEVLAVARNEVRGNIFTADIERVRLSLEKLPWVRSVAIRREFPDRLAVRIEEHRALARWNNTALVNTHGEVFSAESVQALPDFIGQAGDSNEIAQRYTQFAGQLAPLGLSISRLALSPRHAWQVRLSNGLLLELGREQMQERLARFVAVQKTTDRIQMAEGTVKYVDMRYRNGFAVGGRVKS